MPDIILEEIPEGKVYNIANISAATLFGGPLVGAYLIAQNFKVLGGKRKANLTWVVAIVLIVLLYAVPAALPTFDKIPNIVYALFFAFLASWTTRRFQLHEIKEHISKGGEVYPTKRVIVVTLIGLVTLAVIALVIFLIQDTLFIFKT